MIDIQEGCKHFPEDCGRPDPRVRTCHGHPDQQRYTRASKKGWDRAKFWWEAYGVWSLLLIVFDKSHVWCRLYNLLTDSDEEARAEEKSGKDMKERDIEERDMKERDMKERDMKERDMKERDMKERDMKEKGGEDIIEKFLRLYFKECNMTVLAVSIPNIATIWKHFANFPLIGNYFRTDCYHFPPSTRLGENPLGSSCLMGLQFACRLLFSLLRM